MLSEIAVHLIPTSQVTLDRTPQSDEPPLQEENNMKNRHMNLNQEYTEDAPTLAQISELDGDTLLEFGTPLVRALSAARSCAAGGACASIQHYGISRSMMARVNPWGVLSGLSFGQLLFCCTRARKSHVWYGLCLLMSCASCSHNRANLLQGNISILAENISDFLTIRQ